MISFLQTDILILCLLFFYLYIRSIFYIWSITVETHKLIKLAIYFFAGILSIILWIHNYDQIINGTQSIGLQSQNLAINSISLVVIIIFFIESIDLFFDYFKNYKVLIILVVYLITGIPLFVVFPYFISFIAILLIVILILVYFDNDFYYQNYKKPWK